MYKVIVPATSANLGSGFDCMGMALNLYNIIEVEEIGEGLRIEIRGQEGKIPANENNLIYRSMKMIFDKTGYKPKGLRIIQSNEIPVTRGLGSSAACIVGGLFAANEMTHCRYSDEELMVMAAGIDGHPDNTTPAVVGGLTAVVQEDNRLFHARIEVPRDIKFAAFIPGFTLSTTKARMILPERIHYRDAVFNVGRAALLAASLAAGNLENLKCAFEDKLHQPYRKRLIPDMDRIFAASLKHGAKGCFISGAGPTIMALLDGDYEVFQEKMGTYIKSLNTVWELRILEISQKGVQVFAN